MGNKTAFLLANVHQGSSLLMLKAISEEAGKRDNSATFVFPGGRLSYRDANEYLSNEVFSLCNKSNIDKAIIWSSSLTGKVDYTGVAEFVERLNRDVPVVSIGQTIENIPSVDFDAYPGIFKEIEHLINVHGCRRIAFVRGPKSHISSETRFRAYKDALSKNGILYDEKIVSSPRAWSEGNLSMKELIEERGLKPGVDFDAIAFASDLLMFWGSKYLERIGIDILNDIRVTGFNDSEENALMAVSATTVKMPIRELVEASFRLSEDMTLDSRLSSAKIVLPTNMVIRASCGCEDSFGGIDNARKEISSWGKLHEWIERISDTKECAGSLCSLLDSIYADDDIFSNKARLISLLDDYFSKGGKYEFVFESIKWIEAFLSEKHLTPQERDILYSQMAYQNSRCNAYKVFESKNLSSMVDKFKLELLATSNYSVLGEKMKEYLPRIGISKAFVCTYQSDTTTRLECGFSKDTLLQGGEEFSSHLLLDLRYSSELEKGFFVVEPLVYDSYSVGYIILESACFDGGILEDIRTLISTVIKGIRLFDIASEKSRKAEDSEKLSMNLYSDFSEGLKEPLENISKLASSPSIDRSAIELQVTQALHLLELSLAEVGEIEMSMQLVPLSSVLSSMHDMGINANALSDLPAMNMDKSKMDEVFRILSGEISRVGDIPNVSIEVEATSTSFLFSGEKGIWNPAIVEKTSSFMLAEKIILLHHGFFSFSSSGMRISLPFPALNGEIRGSSSIGTVLYISNDNSVPDSIKHLNPTIINEDELISSFDISPSIVSIAMSAKQEERPSAILVNLLRNHVSTKGLPFMLFGLQSESISLSTALEGSASEAERATIFSFGVFPETLSKLSEFGTVVEVETLEQAEDKEGVGSLAILYELDVDMINTLRSTRKFNKTPVLIVKDLFTMEEAEKLAEIPNVLIVNPSIMESEEFISKVVGIFGGGELLPPLTSVLVKKAIAYLNKNASCQISRWQLAEAVNISEDYLTRIFRKEVGISPWDYLNRYRIQLACKLLTQTGLSINEIAQDTGFQDQAYFCRVFKKVKGFPPGHIRQRLV